MTQTIVITSSHFVAAIELKDGYISRAAPILHYMLGWEPEMVQSYCKKKKWVFEYAP